MQGEPLLKIENLVKHFNVRLGAFGERGATVHALDDVNFEIIEGETLSLVGESGCGKSTTGFTILNLHQATSGKVMYKGENIATLDDKAMRPGSSALVQSLWNRIGSPTASPMVMRGLRVE